MATGFIVIGIPVLWLIEPIRRVRMGPLPEDRIGHLGPNVELFCRRRQMYGSPPRTKYIFFAWNPANRHLLKMWKRHLPIVENIWMQRFIMACLPTLRKTRFFQPLPCRFDEHEEMSLGPATLKFTAEETEAGYAALAEMGIARDQPFFCFHSRDPAYLHGRAGFYSATFHRDYRDSDIANYLPAVRHLTDQGMFGLRLGANVEVPLTKTGDSRIVDYATEFRSDFMDIFLAAHCRFLLGNGSGICFLPLIFNVPTAIANFCPFAQTGFGTRMMFIPKFLRHKSDGRLLTFPEIRDLRLFEREGSERRSLYLESTYEELGLEWIENTPEDISELVLDMEDRLAGRTPPAEAVRLQNAFNALYRGSNYHPLAGRIAPRFAMKYRDLIDLEPAQPELVRSQSY